MTEKQKIISTLFKKCKSVEKLDSVIEPYIRKKVISPCEASKMRMIKAKGDEDLQKKINGGQISVHKAYDALSEYPRNERIQKRPQQRLESVVLAQIFDFIEEQRKDVSHVRRWEARSYGKFVWDLYLEHLVKEVFVFRCLVNLTSAVRVFCPSNELEGIGNHFHVPYVRQETLVLWERDADRFYSKSLKENKIF